MENSIFPIKPKPPVKATNLFKQENTQFQFPSKPIKTSPFPNKSPQVALEAPQKIAETHVNHLCKDGRLKEAVIALDALSSKVSPKTYISLLQSCIDLDSIEQGRELHARIGLVEDVNSFVESKLVSMYAICGRLEDARQVFNEMHERNIFTWTAMIGGYAREQRYKEVLELFFWMMDEGIIPDEFLLPKVLRACGYIGNEKIGELIHSLVIRSGFSSSIQVNNSLLSMYAKCGKLSLARKFFEKMEKKDTVTWNSIISGYCQSRMNEEALRLFHQMQDQGVQPGLVTWNILISSHNQSGNCDLAMELMKEMESYGIVPDVFTWTSMISGLAQNNQINQALELFRDMLLEGVEPNGITIASAISACASLKKSKKGNELHSLGVKIGTAGDVLVGNALIELYSKCGNLDAALRVFDLISERDVFTWNSMIGGYARAGYCGKAYDLFMKMQESSVQPNVVTWNVMISGYIQKGDEDHAMDLFRRMEEKGLIKRNTASWNLLIAGLLQNGHKNKALAIFRQMQSSNALMNSITVLSVLPACASLLATKKVKEIHGCVLQRNLESDISVVNSLIDTYAKSGDIVTARSIFDNLSTRDIISWNSLMNGYVFHGRPDITLDLFDQMRSLGLKPNRGTFTSAILAYSLVGMVEKGKQTFSSMLEDYQISPGLEHYSAMVDLLGRSGRPKEAAQFIEEMSIEPDSSVWNALLTACRAHGNMGLAIHAAEHLTEIEPRNSLAHWLLLQLYDLDGRFENASRLRKSRKGNRTLNFFPGFSWTEVKNKLHGFATGDRSMPCFSSLYAQLDSIAREIKGVAPPDSHRTQLCVEEEEKEEICGVHSEKLAIAFSIISSPDSFSSIRIIKSLRMCKDCHRTAKLISSLHGREIYVYDSKVLHHFKKGKCSCRDYW